MSRAKKKHVCSCGEEFNHGIGLRKHQRQTGHKGSSIVDDDGGGDDAAEQVPPAPAAPAPPVPKEAPAPAPAPARAEPSPPPAVEAPKAATPPPPPPAQNDGGEDAPDQTVPVPRPGGQSVAPVPVEETWEEYDEGPSRYHHNRQKLSLVSSGLKSIAKSRARTAKHQLKQSARSGADIFTEALKIAVSLLLLMAIPAGVFWWWWTQRRVPPPPVEVPSTFTFEQGALAARSALLQYLDALQKNRIGDAYGQLSSGWQRETTEVSFAEAFTSISDIRWAVKDQRLLADGSAEVSLVLAYVEDGRARKFQGRFRLTQEAQVWKVDRAELSSIPST